MLEHVNTEEILCVHRDKVCYLTAEAVPVLVGSDIYELIPNNPVMVTSYKSLICVGEGAISQAVQRKIMPNLGVTTEGESVPNSECGEAAMEGYMIKQRMEEVPTTIPQELKSLEINADGIRQWQATDLTLAKARNEEGKRRMMTELALTTTMSCFTKKWSSVVRDIRSCIQQVL